MPPTNLFRTLPSLSLFIHLSLVLFLLPSTLAAASPEDNDTIRLQLRWYHQFQFAGYYAAIEKGFYREEGLKVEVIEGGRGKNTTKEVLAGRAEYGVTNSELLLHRLNGKPLVALASIFQHSPLVFVAKASSAIATPQDMAGKIVKMSRSGRDIELQAMLHNEGLEFDQLVVLEEVATSEDYFDHTIDVLAAYITNQPYLLQKEGIPFNVIKPETYGIDFYGDCLFTSEQEANLHPERVAAFRRASLKGWEYALSNVDEIIELIKTKYKSSKSREHLRYEADQMNQLILPGLINIGHMNPGRWNHIADIFHRYQMVPDEYSLDGFIYTPQADNIPHWLHQALFALIATILFIFLVAAALLVFNRRLKKEINDRRKTESALHRSEQKLLNYSRQTEQFSLSAASVLSIRDEKVLFKEISKAIVEHSDFQRVLIFLFKDEKPYRELIGHAGVSEEIVVKVRNTDLSQSWYADIFKLGLRLGQKSYYVPHTMKEIFNQDAVIYGEGPLPTTDNEWHPEDNLFVRMDDENDQLMGIISVDTSKSGEKPTDEVVRPLEIYSSLISQIIILKREHNRRQQLEQQLRHSQKMEALGNLTGGIAHDFNNILGIIVGNAELALLDTPDWNPTHHNLNEIKLACHRAKDIVQHLLTFSRKSDKELRPVVIADVLRDSLRFLRNTIPTSIDLTSEISLTSETILADPAQIYQALLNLCNNAAHAMEQHGGKLTITATAVTLNQPLAATTLKIPKGEYVCVEISDTGHGIEPAFLEKIFDPYYTTREFGKGTGMGLSIVHGIIQSHNGAITVQSDSKSGSTFAVYLPRLQDSTSLTETPAAPVSVGSEKILLVDDDPSLIEVTRRMLEKQGYAVYAYTQPESALSAFRQSPDFYDLVITDMTMPYLSGSDVVEQILQIRPELPVFLCTGYSDRLNEQEATRLGVTRYFEKPIDTETFTKAIREALECRPHA